MIPRQSPFDERVRNVRSKIQQMMASVHESSSEGEWDCEPRVSDRPSKFSALARPWARKTRDASVEKKARDGEEKETVSSSGPAAHVSGTGESVDDAAGDATPTNARRATLVAAASESHPSSAALIGRDVPAHVGQRVRVVEKRLGRFVELRGSIIEVRCGGERVRVQHCGSDQAQRYYNTGKGGEYQLSLDEVSASPKSMFALPDDPEANDQTDTIPRKAADAESVTRLKDAEVAETTMQQNALKEDVAAHKEDAAAHKDDVALPEEDDSARSPTPGILERGPSNDSSPRFGRSTYSERRRSKISATKDDVLVPVVARRSSIPEGTCGPTPEPPAETAPALSETTSPATITTPPAVAHTQTRPRLSYLEHRRSRQSLLRESRSATELGTLASAAPDAALHTGRGIAFARSHSVVVESDADAMALSKARQSASPFIACRSPTEGMPQLARPKSCTEMRRSSAPSSAVCQEARSSGMVSPEAIAAAADLFAVQAFAPQTTTPRRKYSDIRKMRASLQVPQNQTDAHDHEALLTPPTIIVSSVPADDPVVTTTRSKPEKPSHHHREREGVKEVGCERTSSTEEKMIGQAPGNDFNLRIELLELSYEACGKKMQSFDERLSKELSALSNESRGRERLILAHVMEEVEKRVETIVKSSLAQVLSTAGIAAKALELNGKEAPGGPPLLKPPTPMDEEPEQEYESGDTASCAPSTTASIDRMFPAARSLRRSSLAVPASSSPLEACLDYESPAELLDSAQCSESVSSTARRGSLESVGSPAPHPQGLRSCTTSVPASARNPQTRDLPRSPEISDGLDAEMERLAELRRYASSVLGIQSDDEGCIGSCDAGASLRSRRPTSAVASVPQFGAAARAEARISANPAFARGRKRQQRGSAPFATSKAHGRTQTPEASRDVDDVQRLRRSFLPDGNQDYLGEEDFEEGCQTARSRGERPRFCLPKQSMPPAPASQRDGVPSVPLRRNSAMAPGSSRAPRHGGEGGNDCFAGRGDGILRRHNSDLCVDRAPI